MKNKKKYNFDLVFEKLDEYWNEKEIRECFDIETVSAIGEEVKEVKKVANQFTENENYTYTRT